MQESQLARLVAVTCKTDPQQASAETVPEDMGAHKKQVARRELEKAGVHAKIRRAEVPLRVGMEGTSHSRGADATHVYMNTLHSRYGGGSNMEDGTVPAAARRGSPLQSGTARRDFACGDLAGQIRQGRLGDLARQVTRPWRTHRSQWPVVVEGGQRKDMA